MNDLDRVLEGVAAQKTPGDSVAQLLGNLVALMRGAGPEAVVEKVEMLARNGAVITDHVVANTVHTVLVHPAPASLRTWSGDAAVLAAYKDAAAADTPAAWDAFVRRYYADKRPEVVELVVDARSRIPERV